MNIPSSHTYRIEANGITQQVTVTGASTDIPILLLHGWPLTSHMWRLITPTLVAAGYRTIAPDLRGIGGSDRPASGYDIESVADDIAALLDALEVRDAFVVGIDLGTPIAWMLAMRHEKRVRRLAIMEGLLGQLSGAEKFLAGGPPWWFGFHRVPGLAERVLDGNEAVYIDWFLKARGPGQQDVDETARDFYVKAYSGADGMRGGFEHYRAMPVSARQIESIVSRKHLTQPTLAISGGIIGDALSNQLQGHADCLESIFIANCGHNIPEEQPEALASALLAFFSETKILE